MSWLCGLDAGLTGEVVGSNPGHEMEELGRSSHKPLPHPIQVQKGYLAIGRDGKCCVIDYGVPNRLHTGVWPPGV